MVSFLQIRITECLITLILHYRADHSPRVLIVRRFASTIIRALSRQSRRSSRRTIQISLGIASFAALDSRQIWSNEASIGTALTSGLSTPAHSPETARHSSRRRDSRANKSAALREPSPDAGSSIRACEPADKMHYPTIPSADEGGRAGVGSVC